jgi:hypothetical protein
VKVSVITDNHDFFDLISQYSNIDTKFSFVKYNSFADYKDKDYVNDILIIETDIKDDDVGRSDNIIIIKKDFEKPYRVADVIQKLKAIEACYKYKINDSTLNAVTKELTFKGRKIELTETEFKILIALINTAPNTLEKKELLEKVFGYSSDVDTHTLENHIYRLRKKIGDDGNYIVTDKVGYKIPRNS